jgi:predicted phage terminase large subunit-like protein
MKTRYKKLYRSDFFSFAQKAIRVALRENIGEQEYLHVMGGKLEALLTGKSKRLIINLPPRHLKTWMCSITFAAYYLATNPTKEILVVCHDDKLATQIVENIREIFRSAWFEQVFPHVRIKGDHSRVDDFKTTQNGNIKAITIHGGHAGRGADLIIFDDVLDIPDWNNENRKEKVLSNVAALFSRLNKPNEGLAIFVAHRLHENDPSAALLATGQWDHLCLPFCAVKREEFDLGYTTYVREPGTLLRPDAFDARELEQARRTVEPPFDYFFQQGIAERLVPTIKRKHFRTYARTEFDFSGIHHVISIDPAQKGGEANSHNSIQVWATDREHHWLRERFHKRCDFQVLLETTLRLARKYNPSVMLIEDTANGSALINQIGGRYNYRVEAITPKGSKRQRLNEVAHLIVSKKIFIPDWVPWKDSFRDEFVNFPWKGTDQVDATTQELRFILSNPELELRERQTGIGVALGSQRTAWPITTGLARVGMASRSSGINSGPGPGARHPELRDQSPNSVLSDLYSFDGITVKRYR